MRFRRDPAFTVRTDTLVREAAERAAALAVAKAEQDKVAAVERAVRDVTVDRELQDHAEHLAQINGSQAKMADSLAQLARAATEQASANQAVAKHVRAQSDRRLSRVNQILLAIGAIGAYAGLIGLLIANHHGPGF